MSGIALAIGATLAAGGSIYGGIAQRKLRKKMDRRRRSEQKKLNAQRQVYRNLDTSNPFLNMENTMEDLTINQKQADFEKQTFEQSQSNILSSLRGAAGGSGVAALAQSLAQQGQLASQRSAASIGQQERQNQMAKQQMAGQIQQMERQGERQSQQMEMQKQGTLLGIANQRTNMYQQQAIGAEQAGNQMIQQGMTQAGNTLTSMGTEQIKGPNDTMVNKYDLGFLN
jgi:hypothetical protein